MNYGHTEYTKKINSPVIAIWFERLPEINWPVQYKCLRFYLEQLSLVYRQLEVAKTNGLNSNWYQHSPYDSI